MMSQQAEFFAEQMSEIREREISTDGDFNDFSEVGHIKQQYQEEKLWKVNDSLASRMDLKFADRDSDPFFEFIFEGMGQSPLEYAHLPPGLFKWLEVAFLRPFRIPPSKIASAKDIAVHVLRHLDYSEPYYYLVDMPVKLTSNSTDFTYQMKDDKSVLDPVKIEVFSVDREWQFKHYKYVHDFLQNKMVHKVLEEEYLPHHPAFPREATQVDVFKKICGAVYGNYDFWKGWIEEWSTSFYDELLYEAKTVEEKTDIQDAMVIDMDWWIAVSLGVLTWLKSPYGLKFLTEYHPIYAELLEWDSEIKKIRMRPESGNEVVVMGWAIHTLQDVEKLANVPPGTCCVTGQLLHCTKRVNATFVSNPICYCGQPRNMFGSEHSSGHYEGSCRKFESEHPDRYVFISYGALDNIMNKRASDTKCERHTCPNTKCQLHAGHWMRVQALTNQRTKMLTSSQRN